MFRQLSDINFYERLNHDPTEEFNTYINKFIEDIRRDGQITADIKDVLVTDRARTPEFFLLPKTHKGIISGNGSPTEKIWAFVDFLLKPHIPRIQFYVRDTNHVLELLNLLSGMGLNTIIASRDVSSLYTNIPNQEEIATCGLFLERYRKPWSLFEWEIKNSDILRLLEMVLRMNNFQFNGNHFL